MLLNVNTYSNSVIKSLFALVKFMEVLMNVYLPYSFNWRKSMYILRKWTAKGVLTHHMRSTGCAVQYWGITLKAPLKFLCKQTSKDQKPGNQGKKIWRFIDGVNFSTGTTLILFVRWFLRWIFIVFRHFDKVNETYLDAKNWLWSPCLVNQSIKYDKYALELWISSELAPESQFYKAEMKIFKESVQDSIGLWICLPWDFCASSWDSEIALKTVRLDRSV